MFDVLSGARKREKFGPATLTASVAVHLLLVGGALHAAGGEPPSRHVAAPADTIIVWDADREPPPPEPEPPALEAPPLPEPGERPPVPGETLELRAPDEVPDAIRDEAPGTAPVDPRDYLARGTIGEVIGTPAPLPVEPAGRPGTAPPADFVPDESMVEVRPELNRSGLSRALERYYPPVLRDSRVAGRVVLELVVDERGRVRPGSARVTNASHPAFGDAALRAVERFQFTPGRMGGVAVPVRVTVPVVWAVP
jgi:periplasmic protein TonB